MSQRGLDASAAARRHDDLPVEPAAKPGAERVGEIRAIADSLPAESPPASSAIPSPTAQSIPAAPVADELAQLRESVGVLSTRLAQIERRNLWMRSLLVMVLLASTYLLYFKVFPEGVIVQQTLMESRELKLVDRDGNPRLFLRMYSKVPVLQILDEDGRPRMSMGLRFDDTPFLKLDDKHGRTRVTIEITEDDSPALSIFDELGDVKFQIK